MKCHPKLTDFIVEDHFCPRVLRNNRNITKAIGERSDIETDYILREHHDHICTSKPNFVRNFKILFMKESSILFKYSDMELDLFHANDTYFEKLREILVYEVSNYKPSIRELKLLKGTKGWKDLNRKIENYERNE